MTDEEENAITLKGREIHVVKKAGSLKISSWMFYFLVWEMSHSGYLAII